MKISTESKRDREACNKLSVWKAQELSSSARPRKSREHLHWLGACVCVCFVLHCRHSIKLKNFHFFFLSLILFFSRSHSLRRKKLFEQSKLYFSVKITSVIFVVIYSTKCILHTHMHTLIFSMAFATNIYHGIRLSTTMTSQANDVHSKNETEILFIIFFLLWSRLSSAMWRNNAWQPETKLCLIVLMRSWV